MSDLPDIDEALEALSGSTSAIGDVLVDGHPVSPRMVAIVLVVEDAIGQPVCIARCDVAGGVRTVMESEEAVAAYFREVADDFEEAARKPSGPVPSLALSWTPDTDPEA